jgi:hypothetical protein
MPRGDRTGPAGMGPMTGGAAGFCAGYSVPGFMNTAGGRGYWGRGRGGGRGFRHWYHATGLPGWARFGRGYPAWGGPVGADASAAGQVGPIMTSEQELDALKQQAELFRDELGQINKRIEHLEAETQK